MIHVPAAHVIPFHACASIMSLQCSVYPTSCHSSVIFVAIIIIIIIIITIITIITMHDHHPATLHPFSQLVCSFNQPISHNQPLLWIFQVALFWVRLVLTGSVN